MQLLNVAFGGTNDLYLSKILGAEELTANLFHHQAADTIGAGLRACAVAKDGVVEALEAEDCRPIVGVQFHPEECAPFYPNFDKLFKWLVKRARQQ